MPGMEPSAIAKQLPVRLYQQDSGRASSSDPVEAANPLPVSFFPGCLTLSKQSQRSPVLFSVALPGRLLKFLLNLFHGFRAHVLGHA